jgi:hypothetical protein
MKKLLSILFVLLNLTALSQIKSDAPDRDNCWFINYCDTVISGQLIGTFQGDTTRQCKLYYYQIDSLRVIFTDSCPIAPIIKKGLLSGRLLMDVGFHLTHYNDIVFETLIYKIKDESNKIETWEGYYIFFGVEELYTLETNQTRVFGLTSYSGGGDEYIVYYLELENLSSNKATLLDDFMKKAYISCLKSWYGRI